MSVKSVTLFHQDQISETVLINPNFNKLGIYNNVLYIFVYICVYLCIFVYICVYLCIFVFHVNELVVMFGVIVYNH